MIAMVLAFSRSATLRTPAASMRVLSSGSNIVPPRLIWVNAPHCAAPCINGGNSITRIGGVVSARWTSSS
jgi:hypothetical protein